MSDVDDWDEQDDPGERDDDYDDDPRDDREPDPEDWAYEEEADHREQVHGGGECDCRPSLRDRLTWMAGDAVRRAGNARARLVIAARGPVTVRAGRAEITVRLLREYPCGGSPCGACSGRGWFYTMTPNPEFPVPPGYNGAALCGCGSAIGKLADTRRYLRDARNQPPF